MLTENGFNNNHIAPLSRWPSVCPYYVEILGPSLNNPHKIATAVTTYPSELENKLPGHTALTPRKGYPRSYSPTLASQNGQRLCENFYKESNKSHTYPAPTMWQSLPNEIYSAVSAILPMSKRA